MSWRSLNPKLKKEYFENLGSSPGVWLLQALELRDAANRIEWIEHPIRQDESSLGLANVHMSLLALSVENLLKGILATQREVAKDGKLLEKFSHHKLKRIAEALGQPVATFSEEELELLDLLKEYVEWAGRYPFPKVADRLIVLEGSSMELEKTLILWDRLYQILLQLGWVVKAGGRRLYFKNDRSDGQMVNVDG